jgi:hypothetical protein
MQKTHIARYSLGVIRLYVWAPDLKFRKRASASSVQLAFVRNRLDEVACFSEIAWVMGRVSQSATLQPAKSLLERSAG